MVSGVHAVMEWSVRNVGIDEYTHRIFEYSSKIKLQNNLVQVLQCHRLASANIVPILNMIHARTISRTLLQFHSLTTYIFLPDLQITVSKPHHFMIFLSISLKVHPLAG